MTTEDKLLPVLGQHLKKPRKLAGESTLTSEEENAKRQPKYWLTITRRVCHGLMQLFKSFPCLMLFDGLDCQLSVVG